MLAQTSSAAAPAPPPLLAALMATAHHYPGSTGVRDIAHRAFTLLCCAAQEIGQPGLVATCVADAAPEADITRSLRGLLPAGTTVVGPVVAMGVAVEVQVCAQRLATRAGWPLRPTPVGVTMQAGGDDRSIGHAAGVSDLLGAEHTRIDRRFGDPDVFAGACDGCGSRSRAGDPPLRLCSGCPGAYFCSAVCAQASWRRHKPACRAAAAAAGERGGDG